MSARAVHALLEIAGRHGPVLLCVGVLIGLLVPALAQAARPLFGLAVFAFTLGAFLKVDARSFRAVLADRRGTLLVFTWSAFGVPLCGWGAVQLLPLPADLATGLLLYLLAPPVGSAAAIAAMLGLSAPLALFATITAMAIAPFTLPPLALAMTGAELSIDPVVLALRLGVIVGAAALCAWVMRRFTGRWIERHPDAMTGIAVLGLLVVALAAMRGVQAQILAAPWIAMGWLTLAFALNAGLQALGTLLFAGDDRVRALSMGLCTGNRSVTLVWAAAAPFIDSRPGVELYLAMSLLPIFMLPLATRWLLAREPVRRWRDGEPGRAIATPLRAPPPRS